MSTLPPSASRLPSDYQAAADAVIALALAETKEALEMEVATSSGQRLALGRFPGRRTSLYQICEDVVQKPEVLSIAERRKREARAKTAAGILKNLRPGLAPASKQPICDISAPDLEKALQAGPPYMPGLLRAAGHSQSAISAEQGRLEQRLLGYLAFGSGAMLVLRCPTPSEWAKNRSFIATMKLSAEDPVSSHDIPADLICTAILHGEEPACSALMGSLSLLGKAVKIDGNALALFDQAVIASFPAAPATAQSVKRRGGPI